MRANAAICLALCGAGLMALASRHQRLRQVAASAVSVLVMLLAGATLLQDLGNVNFGIDQWLVADNAPTVRAIVPGRMSPPTSFSLILIAVALFLASKRTPSRYDNTIVGALALVVIAIGGIAIVARASEKAVDFRFLSYTRIASYSAFALVLNGIALLAYSRGRSQEHWSLDRTTTASFAVGAFALIVMAGISYQFTSQMGADVTRVVESQRTLKGLSELSSALGDFTISAGRYIITREERTLDTRTATKAAVIANLIQLRERYRGAPSQLERLDTIAGLHAQRVVMSDEIITNVRAGTLMNSPDSSPLGQQYPALGVAIENLLKVMTGDADATLDEAEKRAKATSAKTFLVLPLTLFFAMTMLSLSLFHINANASARVQADLRVANKRARLNILHSIDRAISLGKSPAEIAAIALPPLRALLGLPRVAVGVLDAHKPEIEWVAVAGRRRTQVIAARHYTADLMGDLVALRRGERQVIDVGTLTPSAEKEAMQASGIRWYIVIPLCIGDELIGGLTFGGPSQHFSSDQQEIATEVAAQIAIAVAQAHLRESANEADARYRRVFETVPVGVVMTTPDGTILSLNPALARTLGFESAELAQAGLLLRIENAFVDSGDHAIFLESLRRDGVLSQLETQFYQADGSHVWVSISSQSVYDAKKGETQYASMIDDITVRKAQEVRIARLDRVKEMQSSVNSAVVRIRDRQMLLDELCHIAVHKGGLRAAWVAWQDDEARKLRPVASAGFTEGYFNDASQTEGMTLGECSHPVLHAFESGESHVTPNAQEDADFFQSAAEIARGYQSSMYLPLTMDSAVTGVLVLFADIPTFFDDEERRLLDELAADVSFALESLEKSERLDYLAYYDPLSGLPNRTLFQDRLAQTILARGGEQKLAAVALLDIERFRFVNETYGRHAGDTLLRDIASRLLEANDTAARFGLNTFGVVLPRARNVAEISHSVEALLAHCFASAFVVNGVHLRVACRTALSIYPHDGVEAEELLHNAEAALKLSKDRDDRVVYYAADMNARVSEALAIESKLRRAVERQEFVLHYQPKVSLASSHIVGLEALIRWQDPDSGLIPPARFIPVLEETGMIVEVGRWAVEQAFRDLQAWAALGLSVPRVAVNVSAIQLQRKDFVATMVDEIRRGGDNPEWLELEITEGLVMRDVKESTGKLSILRGMGVTVAIDDFGTGYSSLSYLSRLPVDSLKIDRSFVSGLPDSAEAEAIASTIIALAHSLRLKVVAEGVETRGQAQMLDALGCDYGQGYLFSRPVPATEIAVLLETGVLAGTVAC